MYFSNDEMYNCLWINIRSPNVFEFQFGLNYSLNSSEPGLCAPFNFMGGEWMTQGRTFKTIYQLFVALNRDIFFT